MATCVRDSDDRAKCLARQPQSREALGRCVDDAHRWRHGIDQAGFVLGRASTSELRFDHHPDSRH
jgi:hypothetical protein